MSQNERTGWRDQWISQRHRQWGWDVPAVDVDCVVTEEGFVTDEGGWPVNEYDRGIPVALIEYKAVGATIRLTDANNRALKNLADMAGLPFFIVMYNKDTLRFGVVPVNEKSKQFCLNRVVYSEPQFIEFLYRLRGRTPPQQKEVACEHN